MRVSQLMNVMKYQLKHFNDEGVVIDNDTIHDTVLSDNDGFSTQTASKSVYKGVIRWTLAKAKQDDRDWPADWMSMSVADLAAELLS